MKEGIIAMGNGDYYRKENPQIVSSALLWAGPMVENLLHMCHSGLFMSFKARQPPLG